jgi:hypothetical protein
MRKKFFRWLYGLPFALRIAIIVVFITVGGFGGLLAADALLAGPWGAFGLFFLGMCLAGVGFYHLAPRGFLEGGDDIDS